MRTRDKTSETTRRNFVAKRAKTCGAGFHSKKKFDGKVERREARNGIREQLAFD